MKLRGVTSASAVSAFGCGLAVILLSAALSGCGSDSGSSAGTTTPTVGTTTIAHATSLDAWALGLCQEVAAWQKSVKATSAKLANSQADFESASQAITSADQDLVGSLTGLGTPPAPATTRAKDVIDKLSTNLQQESAEVMQALNQVVRTQSEVAKASTQARSSISKMNGDISMTVNELKALPNQQGWKKAFREAPACRTVANG
jgi:septal ring factor EnvC (AmiA/AmiB activator)